MVPCRSVEPNLSEYLGWRLGSLAVEANDAGASQLFLSLSLIARAPRRTTQTTMSEGVTRFSNS